MKTDYLIEDLVFQNRDHVVYRALHKDGTPHALLRFRYSEEILGILRQQNRFSKALEQLRALDHPCLRPVVDGGLDPIDGQPWIAARWWEGDVLTESPPTREDIERIREQCQDLIVSLGDRAGALSFRPSEIVTSHADDGQPVHTFAIDYFLWFRDWAIGYAPGEKIDPHAALAHLVASLVTAPSRKSAPLITVSAASKIAPSDTPSPATSAGPLHLPIPKSSPLKPALLIGALLVLIGAGVWWIQQRSAPSKAPVAAKANVSKKTPPRPAEEPKSKPLPAISDGSHQSDQSDKSDEMVTAPEATAMAKTAKTLPLRKERPKFAGELLDIEASDTAALKNSIGDWIILTGTISGKDGNDLQFENSSVVARLPEDAPATKPDQKTTVTGYLSLATLLEVELPEDLQLIAPPVVLRPIEVSGDTYTIEDEEKLRGMGKGDISIQAIVTDYFESSSGKSAYLNLSPRGKTIAMRLSKKTAAKNGLDEAALRALVGKELKITGSLEIERFTERLLIKASKESDWEMIGE